MVTSKVTLSKLEYNSDNGKLLTLLTGIVKVVLSRVKLSSNNHGVDDIFWQTYAFYDLSDIKVDDLFFK